MMSATARQQKLLNFIDLYQSANDGLSPSYDQMGAHMGLVSKGSVARMVYALENRGLIRRIPHHARCIEIIRGSTRQSAADIIIQMEDGLITAVKSNTLVNVRLERFGTSIPLRVQVVP